MVRQGKKQAAEQYVQNGIPAQSTANSSPAIGSECLHIVHRTLFGRTQPRWLAPIIPAK